MIKLKLFEYLERLSGQELRNNELDFFLRSQWIRYFLVRVDKAFLRHYPFYTLHNHQHSDTVVENMYNILHTIGMLDDRHSYPISCYETFFLIASAYLHDIGMIEHKEGDEILATELELPLGEFIRAIHHERSAEFVQQNGSLFFLSDKEANIIAALCRGHRLDSFETIEFEERQDDHSHPIRVKFLAALLQIADELDMTSLRAPAYEFPFVEGILDRVAYKHWMKHRYTESVDFKLESAPDTSKKILRVYITLAVPNQYHFEYLSKEIYDRMQLHLKMLNTVFKENNFEIELATIKPYFSSTAEDSLLFKSQVKILYVDDDDINRKRIKQALEARKFSCETRCDSRQALAEVALQRNQQYHLIILDLHMPDLQDKVSYRAGIELIDPIKQLAPHTQILLFTATDYSDPIVREALKKGVYVINKEKHLDVLMSEVEQSLGSVYIFIDDLQQQENIMTNNLYIPSPYYLLFVDDEESNSEGYIRALENQGFKVEYVPGADIAAEKLKTKKYHGVILDKEMNNRQGVFDKEAGIELSKYILKEYPDLYCLILTAAPTVRSMKETEDQENMFDYLEKVDFTPKQVAKRVAEMMSARKTTVSAGTGMVIEADRMHFFGKTGVVVKAVTRETGDRAGIVEIEGEKWLATTRDTKGFQTTSSILVGLKVRAYGIKNGAIQVVAIDY